MGLRGEAAIVGIAELAADPQARHGRPVSPSSSGRCSPRKHSMTPGCPPTRSTASSPAASPSLTCSRPRPCRSTSASRSTSARSSTSAAPRSAGMVWRAAAAIELGLCDVVLAVVPGSLQPARRRRRGRPGDPATSARRATSTGRRRPSSRFPTATSGRTHRTRRSPAGTRPSSGTTRGRLAKIAADQRTNACAHPGAVFYGKPITVDDVLASPMVADPIHMLEIVMPCHGGAAVVVASRTWRGGRRTGRSGSRGSASG